MSTESRIAAIEERNQKVSFDKKWETSFTRRLSICVITYLCGCAIFKYIIPSNEWYLASIVPVVGYVLSTLGLPRMRLIWERYIPIAGQELASRAPKSTISRKNI